MPWPDYTHELHSPMDAGDDLTTEVPRRLSAICGLYGIDESDPLWERRLLMTLLARHVPGFGQRKPRLPVEDNDAIIAIIDETRDRHERNDGRRPSVEAVVVELQANPPPPIKGKSRERLLRIYSGGHSAGHDPDNKSVARLGRMMASSKSLREAPPDSHAALLHAASSAKR